MIKTLSRFGAGLLAAGALAITAAPAHAAVPAYDGTAPAVNFNPGLGFTVDTVLSNSTPSATLPVTLSWTQYDASGICGRSASLYDGNTNSYSYPSVAPTATSYAATATLGGSYNQLNLHTVDCSAQANSSDAGKGFYPSLAQESAFTFGPGWKTQMCNCWSNGGDVASTKIGATASYQFSGSSIALIGVKGYQRGKANIFIDGAKVATVNEYVADRTKGINRGVIWSKQFATNGTHTIKIVVATTAKFDIDGIVTAY